MTINLLDVIKYWKGEPHQVEALNLLQELTEGTVIEAFEQKWRAKPAEKVIAATTQLTPQTSITEAAALPPTLKFSNSFVQTQYDRLCQYAKSGVANLDTKTTYYSQRDNYTMGGRTCNSSSCAMWVDWLRRATGGLPLGGDDDYLRKLLGLGDTIYHEKQSACIERYYGFKSKWIDTEDDPTEADFDQVNSLLDAGFPVVVNINHRGPRNAPRGGHVIMMIARRQSEGTYTAHDPYGTLSSDYENSNGRFSTISKADFHARWQGGRRLLA